MISPYLVDGTKKFLLRSSLGALAIATDEAGEGLAVAPISPTLDCLRADAHAPPTFMLMGVLIRRHDSSPPRMARARYLASGSRVTNNQGRPFDRLTKSRARLGARGQDYVPYFCQRSIISDELPIAFITRRASYLEVRHSALSPASSFMRATALVSSPCSTSKAPAMPGASSR